MNSNSNSNLELMLTESIDCFLVQYRNGSDFSHFASVFSRLVQTMSDPPLEVSWFYAGVTFRGYRSSKSLRAVKDLFQLLISCSTPCNNGLKRVAMLAPVLYELYYISLDWMNMVSCLKREIEALMEGIISFISIYCTRSAFEWENSSDKLMSGFVDLLQIWTVDRYNVGDGLRLFFPLVSDEVCGVVRFGGVSDLAGVVMAEVFFLRLCMKLDSNLSREDLRKDMHDWAVQTINAFQNCRFLDMLLVMLLEPSLPINTLVNRDAENLVREVLYEAVILSEYSFLSSQIWEDQKFAIRWLLVADAAVEFARENCDQNKALSYIDAFSKSRFPIQLIKWASDQGSLGEESCKPNVSTPRALIRWLLTLEDQGQRIFGHYIPKVRSKVGIHKVNFENKKPKPNPNYPIGSIFGCFENNNWGQSKVNNDHEMVEFSDDTSVSGEAERRGKRKEEYPDERETRLKLSKFNHNEDSGREAEIRSNA